MSQRSASRTTGTTSPLGVSAAKPMWMYFLRTRFSPPASSDAVELRELLQRLDAGAHDESQRRELDALLRRLLLELGAHVLERGDVRLVELRDVRNVEPARVQTRPGDLLDAGQRLGLDRAELREVDRGTPGSAPRAPRHAPPPLSSFLTNAFTSSCVMRPLKPVPATCERSTPISRASLRTEARRARGRIQAHRSGRSLRALRDRGNLAIDLGPVRSWRRGAAGLSPSAFQSWRFDGSCIGFGSRSRGASTVSAARACQQARFGALRPAAPRRPASVTVTIKSPSETLPPLATCTFSTLPAAVEGTSIAALSVSSVTSGVSTSMRVARLYQHVDDGDVLEAAHVGHPHFLRAGHRVRSSDLPGIGARRIDAQRLHRLRARSCDPPCARPRACAAQRAR